jgi:hypothetical protein
VKYKESQPPAAVSASKKLKDHTIISNNIKMQLNEQPIRMKQPSESLDLGVSLLIQDLGRLFTDPIIYNNDEVRIELGKVIQQRFEASYLGDIARPDTWGRLYFIIFFSSRNIKQDLELNVSKSRYNITLGLCFISGYAESIRAGSKTHWTCTSCTIPKPDKRSLSLWLTLNNFEKHRYKKHLNDGIGMRFLFRFL